MENECMLNSEDEDKKNMTKALKDTNQIKMNKYMREAPNGKWLQDKIQRNWINMCMCVCCLT